jgi:hypothetical protein
MFAWWAAAADLDGDNDIDIVGCSSDRSNVGWWENVDGSGTQWIHRAIDVTINHPYCVASSDLDMDGDLDVIAAPLLESFITWWENLNGSGTSWEQHDIQNWYGYWWLQSADLDLDGMPDVVGCSQYLGEVAWLDLSTFLPSAYVESSILDTQGEQDWGSILWSATTPSGTAVAFQVRSSPDPGAMGDWSSPIYEQSSLHNILGDGDRYLQYRALLSSESPHASPTLNEVTITWDPLGTGGSSEPECFILQPVVPNPSGPSPSVHFGLPEACTIALSVFDISGRLIQSFEPAEYQAGSHEVQLKPVDPGIYFVRMTAGEFR